MPIYKISSVITTFKVIELFCQKKQALGVTEISKALSIDKPVVYRVLSTLQELGYVVQNPRNEKYWFSAKFVNVSSIILSQLDLRQKSLPPMRELTDKTGEVTHLAILEGWEVIYMEKIESPQLVRLDSWVGMRMPAYATALGKVLLAYSPREVSRSILENKKLVKLTRHTITNIEKLEQQFQEIKKKGSAIDDREQSEDVRCIAAPIKDHTGEVVAAISCSAPTNRMSLKRAEKLMPIVERAAMKISIAMGYPHEKEH